MREFTAYCLLLIMVACLLAACDLTGNPAPTPLATETPSVEPIESVTFPPDVRPCLVADLEAVAGYQVAGGSMAGAVLFTNTSATSCVLEGSPGIHLLDAGGNLMPVANLDLEQQPIGDGRFVVQSGGDVYVPFVWSNWCGQAQGPYTLAVALPGEGGQLDVPALDPKGEPLSNAPKCEQADSTSTIKIGRFQGKP